jgi:hypothetical protein
MTNDNIKEIINKKLKDVFQESGIEKVKDSLRDQLSLNIKKGIEDSILNDVIEIVKVEIMGLLDKIKIIKDVELPKIKEQLTQETLPRIVEKIRKEIFKT